MNCSGATNVEGPLNVTRGLTLAGGRKMADSKGCYYTDETQRVMGRSCLRRVLQAEPQRAGFMSRRIDPEA